MASSVALDASSGIVTMSLASNSRALTTMKQIFSGEIESAGVVLVAAASSAGDTLLSGLPALMGLSPGLVAQHTPRGGRNVEIGQVRSRPIQLPFDLHVGALDRRPGDAVRGLLLARIAYVRREGMIEGLAVDVLGVWRNVCLHRRRQIAVGTVWHGRYLGSAIWASVIEKRPPNISQAA